MKNVTKILLKNIFHKNEHIYICRDEFSTIHPEIIELTSTRFLAFAGDNFDYKDALNSCCEKSKGILHLFYARGFRAWGIVIGPTLNKNRIDKIKNYSVFNGLSERGLILSNEIIHREKTYQLYEGVRHAGIFEINPDKLFEACLFTSQTIYSMIVISNRCDFTYDNNIDCLFNYGTISTHGASINNINWRAMTIATCSYGDLVIRVSGAFDDPYRALNFIYCKSAINQDFQDIIEKLEHTTTEAGSKQGSGLTFDTSHTQGVTL